MRACVGIWRTYFEKKNGRHSSKTLLGQGHQRETRWSLHAKDRKKAPAKFLHHRIYALSCIPSCNSGKESSARLKTCKNEPKSKNQYDNTLVPAVARREKRTHCHAWQLLDPGVVQVPLALVGEARCWWWFCVRCATAARLRGKLNLLRSGVWGEFNLRELVFTEFNSREVVFR